MVHLEIRSRYRFSRGTDGRGVGAIVIPAGAQSLVSTGCAYSLPSSRNPEILRSAWRVFPESKFSQSAGVNHTWGCIVTPESPLSWNKVWLQSHPAVRYPETTTDAGCRNLDCIPAHGP